jgi:chromosome segregation ATPase
VSSIPKAAAQAVPVSASAALAKEQVDTSAPSLSCTLKLIPQAQSQPPGQSAKPTGEVATEQLKQVVTAKLQAHQVTQTQASLAVSATSQSGQPPISSIMTQTDSQDLIKTTQLSAESVQELAIPRLSTEDRKAENLLLQQSYQDALRDLEASKREKQELQDQFEKAQTENQSFQRDRERAEKELIATCDKRDQANRKLEGEKRILESNHATLLKKLSDSQEELHRVQGDLQRAQSNFDEQARDLRSQVRQLTSELNVESKASLQCREQMQKEQEARREMEVQNQSQQWQIEELHGHIVELKSGINSLEQERKCSPDLSAPLPPTVEENHQLKLKLAEAQAELDNTLRQLKRQHLQSKETW